MPPPNDYVYTNENCQSILDEAVGLLRVMRQAEPGKTRLNFLLAEHFASNDFRSFCCFGHEGDQVSLEQFKSLCIRPSTEWNVHLVDSSSSVIEPAFEDASAFQLEQKLKLVSDNVSTLLGHILLTHPHAELINSYFPICGTIGSAWILAILGRKRNNSKGDFVVPPLEELRRRISLSLDAALALKESSEAWLYQRLGKEPQACLLSLPPDS
jgi:hypothetical protein